MTHGDLVNELVNWGRWARDDRSPGGYSESSINRLAGRTRDRDSYEAPPGEVEVAIRYDERAAERLDQFLRQLERRSWVLIRRRYYHREWVDRPELDAAIRSLGDLMDRAARAVVAGKSPVSRR